MDYGASSVSQWVLSELFSTQGYDNYLQELRIKLKMRRDSTLHALDLYFKDIATWTIPKGSFYIWLKLQEEISTDDLFHATRKEKLLLNPGSVYDFEKNYRKLYDLFLTNSIRMRNKNNFIRICAQLLGQWFQINTQMYSL